MSNLSIIERVEERITELELNSLGAVVFAKFLDDSIEALECIPYRLIEEKGHFQNRVETAGFAEEEDFISDSAEVISDLRQWLSNIKKEFY